MHIVVNVFGEEQVSRELLRFGERAVNANAMWVEIARRLLDIETQQFDSEGGRVDPWVPLSAYTLAAKEREGLDPRILHATGELRKSLTRWGAPGQILDINKQSMTFGTKVKDAKYHYTGTKNMPKRKPMDLAESDKRGMIKIVQKYIIGEGQKNWSQG